MRIFQPCFDTGKLAMFSLLPVPSGTPWTEIVFFEGDLTTRFSPKSEQSQQHSLFLNFGIKGFTKVFLLEMKSVKN